MQITIKTLNTILTTIEIIISSNQTISPAISRDLSQLMQGIIAIISRVTRIKGIIMLQGIKDITKAITIIISIIMVRMLAIIKIAMDKEAKGVTTITKDHLVT